MLLTSRDRKNFAVFSRKPNFERLVSGIILRDDKKLNARISNVNKILEEHCEGANFPFIDNSNIEIGHNLNRSGLHSNRFGDAKLAFDIISELRT